MMMLLMGALGLEIEERLPPDHHGSTDRHAGGSGSGSGSAAMMTPKERRTMRAWNRFTLEQWAKRDGQQAGAVSNHRRHVASPRSSNTDVATAAVSTLPYNASHHWSVENVPMPRKSYWAHQGFPPPRDAALWAQCLHQAQSGQQVLLQQVRFASCTTALLQLCSATRTSPKAGVLPNTEDITPFRRSGHPR